MLHHLTCSKYHSHTHTHDPSAGIRSTVLACHRLIQSYTMTTDQNLDSFPMMPHQNLDSQPTIYEFPDHDKAPFDVNVVVYHGGSVTELHAHRYVLGRSSWFEKRIRRDGLNTTPPFLLGGNVSDAPEEKTRYLCARSESSPSPPLYQLLVQWQTRGTGSREPC